VQRLSIEQAASMAWPAVADSGPVLIEGRTRDALAAMPDSVVDAAMTSPPYWAVRRYEGGSTLGEDRTPEEFVDHLVRELAELPRVMKPTGSFWLNIGDTYRDKNLVGIPWRVAFRLQEEGWLLRNAVVWDKVKGNPDNAKDKLRNLHEFVFHFVRAKQYFYDADAIRNPPMPPKVVNGRIVTPTGVSGINYRRQIERNGSLTLSEKAAALKALEDALNKVRHGELSDFRMIIRGQQRTTHSDSEAVSGRASEINKRGYCILPYHPKGSKPGDVWHIIPEDDWRTDTHAAVFPQDLCRIPVLATCPENGVFLDPFVGTGTALTVAIATGRRAVGIDMSRDYLDVAQRRLEATMSEPTQLALD
jgi:DNA modification methylase